MVVETLSLSQDDPESLGCIPPSQDEYDGCLPFLYPGSPTDHETTVIECDVEGSRGHTATLPRDARPQEFPEWQSPSMMDYSSLENDAQKDPSTSSDPQKSSSFERASQSSSSNDSVQFIGFENERSFGAAPSQVSGGFDSANLDLHLTQTQGDGSVFVPASGLLQSNSQLSTCPSSFDPRFPNPSDTALQQTGVVSSSSSSSSSGDRSAAIVSSKKQGDRQVSVLNQPLTNVSPNVKDSCSNNDVAPSQMEVSESDQRPTKESEASVFGKTYVKERQENRTSTAVSKHKGESEKSLAAKSLKPRSKKRATKASQKLTDHNPSSGAIIPTDRQSASSPKVILDSLVEETQEYRFTALRKQDGKTSDISELVSGSLPTTLPNTQIISETGSEMKVDQDCKDRVDTPVSAKDRTVLIQSLSAQHILKNTKGDKEDGAKRLNPNPDLAQKNSKQMRLCGNQFNATSGKFHYTARVKSIYERSSTFVMEFSDGKLTSMSTISEEEKLLKQEFETLDDVLSPVSTSRSAHSLSSGDMGDISSLEQKSLSGSLKSGSLSMISPINQVSTPTQSKSESMVYAHSSGGILIDHRVSDQIILNSIHSLPSVNNNLDPDLMLVTGSAAAGCRSSSGSVRISGNLFSDLESERASFGKDNRSLRRSSESLFSSISNRNSTTSARASDISARVSDVSARVSDISFRVSDASNRNSTASARASDISTRASDISARVSDVSARVSDISFRVSDASNRVSDISDISARSDTMVEDTSVTPCRNESPISGTGADSVFRQPLPPLLKKRSSGSTGSSSGSAGAKRDSGGLSAALSPVGPDGNTTGNQDSKADVAELVESSNRRSGGLEEKQRSSGTSSGVAVSSMDSIIPDTCMASGADVPAKDSKENPDDTTCFMETTEESKNLSEATFTSAATNVSAAEAAVKTPAPGSTQKFQSLSEQHLGPGTPVLALWKDKHYYPAQVVGCNDRGKCSVLFDDGNQLDVKLNSVINLDLVPVGKSVLADCGSGWNELVTIVSYWTENSETGYVVRRPQDSDDGSCDIKVRRSQISLSKEQAASILPEIRTPSSGFKHSLPATSEKKKKISSQPQREPDSSSFDTYQPTIHPVMICDMNGPIEPGVPVFAKWSDRHFYPGRLKSITSNEVYVVTFEDGNESRVSESDLFVCDLLPCGLDVMAEKDNADWSEEAVVVGHYQTADAVGYVVKFDDGATSRLPRKSVTLNQAQATLLLNQLQKDGRSSDFGDLSRVRLDNLKEGKRRRPQGTSPWTTPATKQSARSSRPRSQRKMVTPSTLNEEGQISEDANVHDAIQEPSSSSSSSASGSTLGSKRKKQRMAEINPKATSTPTPKGTKDFERPSNSFKSVTDSPDVGKKSSNKFKTSLFPESERSLLPSGSRIFGEMIFILTHVEKTVEQKEQERKILASSPRDSSTSGIFFMTEDMTVPFDKGFLCQQIESNGGEVMDEFDLEMVVSGSNCFLVSDACQRTRKYFCALAVGIPCVSHLWIRDSCSKGALEDFHDYMLPSGVSLETNQLVVWQNERRPLAGLTIVVSTENRNFIDVWMEILEAAGCNLAPKIPARISSSQVVDVVISDNHISAATYQLAQKRGIPVVSSEWVVQCLVTGYKLNFNDHPKYRHDYE